MVSARELQDDNAIVAEVIGGGGAPILSPEEFETLKAAIFALRDEITGNN